MNERELEQHLSQIVTQWTMLARAHQGAPDEAEAARRDLMQRYCGAVFRYLLRVVRQEDLARDLTQEFALRFLQGRFGSADREHGKFRQYVKRALFNLVQDHYRGRMKEPRAVPIDEELQVPAPDEGEAADRAFRESWRLELLARAWRALEESQRETGQPFHDVLRMRADQPDWTSNDLATGLSEKLGREITPVNVRQLVRRARARFGELLLDDIRASLEGASWDRVEEELAELDLLKYCQDMLEERRGS